MAQNDLVAVEWLDHHSSDAWMQVDDETLTEACVCTTVGWVLHDNEKSIVLYTSKNNSGQIGGTTYIMRSCVQRIKILRAHEGRKRRRPDAKVTGAVTGSSGSPSKAVAGAPQFDRCAVGRGRKSKEHAAMNRSDQYGALAVWLLAVL
jgi:hypothetical protein